MGPERICHKSHSTLKIKIIRFLIEGYPSVQTPPALRQAQGGRTMASPSRSLVRAELVEA